MPNIFQVDERIEVFDLAKERLLSIPGHAEYFRDQINAAKEKVRSGEMRLGAWQTLIMVTFETLGHMPSEETVKVLAEFGADRFGSFGSKDPADYEGIPGMAGWEQDISSMGTARIAGYAYRALDSLGIEPPPYVPGEAVAYRENETHWAQWWQEVKAGKRKYRFKGSNVLHPVDAPSGTGREVRRPERRSVPETTEAPRSARTNTPPAAMSQPPVPRWLLPAGLAAVLLGIAAWFMKRTQLRR